MRSASANIRQQSITPTPTQELLRTGEAARFLGVSASTLKAWRLRGMGPSFIRLSPHSVRYRMRDLEAFAAKREVPAS